jgi:hypothetical protein
MGQQQDDEEREFDIKWADGAEHKEPSARARMLAARWKENPPGPVPFRGEPEGVGPRRSSWISTVACWGVSPRSSCCWGTSTSGRRTRDGREDDVGIPSRGSAGRGTASRTVCALRPAEPRTRDRAVPPRRQDPAGRAGTGRRAPGVAAAGRRPVCRLGRASAGAGAGVAPCVPRRGDRRRARAADSALRAAGAGCLRHRAARRGAAAGRPASSSLPSSSTPTVPYAASSIASPSRRTSSPPPNSPAPPPGTPTPSYRTCVRRPRWPPWRRAGDYDEVLGPLLGARNPRARATGVTALRAAGRPGRAEGFLADRSGVVRACARYVVRQGGGDPLASYRAGAVRRSPRRGP